MSSRPFRFPRTSAAARPRRARPLLLGAGIFCLVASLAGPAAAQSARERAKAEAAAEAGRVKALGEKGLPPAIATCHVRIERSLRRNRSWEAFRSPEDAAAVKTVKASGKFSPRHPVDVQQIAKFPGELRKKRKKADEDEEWVPAEAWCGLSNDELVAADVFGPGEKR